MLTSPIDILNKIINKPNVYEIYHTIKTYYVFYSLIAWKITSFILKQDSD